MKKLFIVRHALTELNKKKVLQGASDAPLTQEGINQAEDLRAYLMSVDFDNYISSSQGRAVATAKLMMKPEDFILLETRDDIVEYDFGIMEGVLIDEARNKWRVNLDSFFENPAHHIPHSTQISLSDYDKAVVEAFKDILAKSTGNTLIVTHGITIRSILKYVLGRSMDDYWIDGHIHGCSICVIFAKEEYLGIETMLTHHFTQVKDF